MTPEERLWRPKSIILIMRWGNSIKQKMLEMIEVTVWLHTDEFIFVWFYIKDNGHQNYSSGTETELLRRAGATARFKIQSVS